MARAKRNFPSLTPQRKNEFWGVLLLAGSLFLLMGLISYHPDDLSFFTSKPNPEVQHLCGVVGAWITGVILITIGWTGYLLPFLGFFWAVARFSRKDMDRLALRMASTVLLLLSTSALLAIVWPQSPQAPIPPGGILGSVVGHQAVIYFGWWGAVVLLLTMGTLCLLLSTELTVWPVLQAGWEAAGSFVRWAGKWIWSSLAGAAGSVSERVRERRTMVVHRAPEKPAETSTPSRPVRVNAPEPEEPVKPRQAAAALSPAPIRPEQSRRTNEAQDRQTSGVKMPFQLPSLDLLNLPSPAARSGQSKEVIEANARLLEETLKGFGIEARVAEVELGPVITRYELEPAPGVKIQRIATLSDDLALALKATSVRVMAPIPGKGRVGVEVPNQSSAVVTLREVLESREFRQSRSKLTLAVGKDAAGHPLVADLAGMPHLLIAGATGSGKTVCVNGLVLSLLFNAAPDEVRFLMVDPKMVELSVFNGLPHLIMPVLTNPKKVPTALEWVVEEMETRYRLFAKLGVRNIEAYHEKQTAHQLPKEEIPDTLPYLVVIIDELADLMMVAQAEAERAIARLAHLSRAVGIHMILATQRPSVDVLTGVIKANFPARISFQVASRVDSRTVLDAIGAEKLLGRGDLLFMPPGASKLIRAQGTLVTDDEIERVVNFLKAQGPASYEVSVLEEVEAKATASTEIRKDPLYGEAVRTVVETGQASVSLLQRRMRLGYGRAARILDKMEEEGIVGPIRGAKPREVFLKEAPPKTATEVVR